VTCLVREGAGVVGDAEHTCTVEQVPDGCGAAVIGSSAGNDSARHIPAIADDGGGGAIDDGGADVSVCDVVGHALIGHRDRVAVSVICHDLHKNSQRGISLRQSQGLSTRSPS
jgi:hypothetical protein